MCLFLQLPYDGPVLKTSVEGKVSCFVGEFRNLCESATEGNIPPCSLDEPHFVPLAGGIHLTFFQTNILVR